MAGRKIFRPYVVSHTVKDNNASHVGANNIRPAIHIALPSFRHRHFLLFDFFYRACQ
jgi:hypothetical protein